MSGEQGMEWRPDRRKKTSESMGEKVARIEERLTGIENKQSATDGSLARVHVRVDELFDKMDAFEEKIHERISEVIQDVEGSLDAHVRDEERLLDVKFKHIESMISHVTEDGQRRGEEAAAGIAGLHKMGWTVTITAGSLVLGVSGYIIAFLFDKGPTILRLLDKLENLPG